MSKKIVIADASYSYADAARKFGVGESTIRARINKLGWTAEEAVGLQHRKKLNRKEISFRGVTYQSQEEFVRAVSSISRFSAVTLKIKLALLNRTVGVSVDEKTLEDLVFGKKIKAEEGGWLYLVQCLATGQEYVGISVRDPTERWRAHLSEAYFSTSLSPLKRAIRRFGESSFKLTSLKYYGTNQELKDAEKREIQQRNSLHPNGLNANRGGTLGALDVEPVHFRGGVYRSIRDLARHFGIKPPTLAQRINSYGMTLDEAVSFNLDRSFLNDGRHYATRKEFCESVGLPYPRIVGLMNQGLSLEEAVSRIRTKAKCDVCGASFHPKNSLNRYCSLSCKQAAHQTRRRVGTTSQPNRRPISYQGKEYFSVSHLAIALGVNRSTLSKALHRFETTDDAVAHTLGRKAKGRA
jgi:transposase-like protein